MSADPYGHDPDAMQGYVALIGAILQRALEPRRLTVAVSRPKRKLIVLASQALFTLMPADLDDYERGALWKHLRHACASPPLWTGEYGGYQLRVLTIQAP